MTLTERVKEIPNVPGVYVMKNTEGQIIYVGKAKNLKNRVSSYFNGSSKNVKTMQMVSNVSWFDYIITPTETDALLLECNLIKKHSPYYNILLKDGKSYPYIKINTKSGFPKIEITRRLVKDGSKYFGPYFNGFDVKNLVSIINEAYKLINCNLKLGKKTYKNPCLRYHIGQCMAPCISQGLENEYSAELEKAIRFLKGDYSEVKDRLTKSMLNFAKAEEFETALNIKLKIEILDRLKERTTTVLNKDISLDVFSKVHSEFNSCICYLAVRSGKVLGVENFITPHKLEEGEFESFVMQFYATNGLNVKQILLDEINENLSEAVSNLSGENITVSAPGKGNLKNLVKVAAENARNYLEKNIERQTREEMLTLGACLELKKALGLKEIPARIECFDIANISGTNSVASMVVFVNGKAEKKMYRKYKIKTVMGPDDFASHAEVFERRLNALIKGEELSFKQKPNLIIIDGGIGQVSATFKILENFRNKLKTEDGLNLLNFDLIGLAEKEEKIYVPNSNEPIILNRGSYALRLLQRVRDEAHRFANSYHRKLRTKNMFN